MKLQFLETYGLDYFTLKEVFPLYSSLWDKVEDLEDKVTSDSSFQLREEYINLLQSIDEFLLRPENLELFKQVIPEYAEIFEDGEMYEKEDAKERLTQEIESITSEISEEQLREQIKIDVQKAKEQEEEELEKLTGADYDEDQRYEGVEFKYTEIKQDHFARCLSMLKAGAKFFYLSLSNKHYVCFRFPQNLCLIIQTPVPTRKYAEIFGGGEGELCYLLAPTKKDVKKLFNLIRYAIDSDYEDFEDLKSVSEEDLYNNPIIKGAYFSNLDFYEPASKFAQGEKMVKEDEYLKMNFSWYFAMEKILALVAIKKITDTEYDSQKSKLKIEEMIETQTFRFEGIGDVPHTTGENSVLKVLQNEGSIDINCEIMPTALGAMEFSTRTYSYGQFSSPDFKPLLQYRIDLKEKFKESKTKYYSEFNGITVFHTEKDINNLKVAIALPGQYQQQWGFEKSSQADIFSNEWQATQNFNSWVEYLPFAGRNNITIRSRNTEKYLKGKLNFVDEYKFDMFVASSVLASDNASIDSSVYNFVKQMYSDRTLRIMGPDIQLNVSGIPVFFTIVDENNNILAVVLAGKKTNDQTDKETGQRFLSFDSDDLSVGDVPGPVWDYQGLLRELNTIAPDFIANGEEISQATSLENTIASDDDEIQEVEDEPTGLPDYNDDVIDPDGEFVLTEEEMSIEEEPLVEELEELPEDVDEYIAQQEAKEDISELNEQVDELSEEPAKQEEPSEKEEEVMIEEEVKNELPKVTPDDEIRKEIEALEEQLDSINDKEKYLSIEDKIDELYDKLKS